MAGHVAGGGDGVPAAAHELLVGAGDPGLEFLVPLEPGALNELGTIGCPQLRDGGAAGRGVGFAPYGRVTIFVPCAGPVRPLGRVTPGLIPAVELAVIKHSGSPADVDRAYGTLAAYVARHALTVDSPIREYYLVGQRDTPDSTQWRTEIGWPIFRMRPDVSRAHRADGK